VTVLEREQTRSGTWLEHPGFGVYVHIPFCRHRCHYCDFNTYEGQDAVHQSYVDALVKDIERSQAPAPVSGATSVFLGGGTPTLLPPSSLGRILRAIRDRFGVESQGEITVEANPETVDQDTFELLLAEGFNRVSIGVQSLVPHVLAGLGRRHSASRAVETMRDARRAGVAEVNADLIYGSPWETPEDWQRSLEGIVAEEPAHISAYALTIEEGTPLSTLIRTGRLPDVDPDVQADRYETACRVLSDAGFQRYEISNWCRPGLASRHNVLYWSAGDYVGFGAGAHGHRSGLRYWNTRLPRDFIAAIESGKPTVSGSERLGEEERGGEALMLGLRLASGIEVEPFRRRFGLGFAARQPILKSLEDDRLLRRDHGWLTLARGTSLVANEVLCRVI
jgi:putative oxygen-independent coproporphyrinogen III oxidase